MLLVAIAVGLVLWAIIQRTRYGMIVRAGVDDRHMVSALGINIQLVFAGAFFVGAFLAGLGGVLGGTMISVDKGNDTQYLLIALIVVIIGGMGSLGGARPRRSRARSRRLVRRRLPARRATRTTRCS